MTTLVLRWVLERLTVTEQSRDVRRHRQSLTAEDQLEATQPKSQTARYLLAPPSNPSWTAKSRSALAGLPDCQVTAAGFLAVDDETLDRCSKRVRVEVTRFHF